MKFTPGELVYNGWVYQKHVADLKQQLTKLKHVLQYNLKNLVILVSIYYLVASFITYTNAVHILKIFF